MNFAGEEMIRRIMDHPEESPDDIIFVFIIEMNYYIALINGSGYQTCFHIARDVSTNIYNLIKGEK